jgi:hypothetical protein
MLCAAGDSPDTDGRMTWLLAQTREFYREGGLDKCFHGRGLWQGRGYFIEVH